jgi:serine/threonine-protein kinase
VEEDQTSTSDQQTASAGQDAESGSANTVVMPTLKGKTMTEAKIELENLGLTITLKGSENSSEYSAGQIIEQSVAEGERVEVGTAIEVVIAGEGSGSQDTANTEEQDTTQEPVVVPGVTGQTEATARAALEAVGLTVGSVTEANSDTVPQGSVISQSLSQNSSVEKGTTINLVVSSGPNKVKVTDVIGHEQSRAATELQNDGFVVSVQEVYTGEVSKGLVVSTNPDRGTYTDPGSTVTITVSKGVETISVPGVSSNMTYEEALEDLMEAGFQGDVEESAEYSDSVGEGYVTRFSPSDSISPDGVVTIYVSLGAESAEE